MTEIYAIQDVLIGFHPPFIGANKEAVIRDYKNAMKKNANSEDMRLFKIGTFDDKTGTIIGCTPECIVGGIKNGDN